MATIGTSAMTVPGSYTSGVTVSWDAPSETMTVIGGTTSVPALLADLFKYSEDNTLDVVIGLKDTLYYLRCNLVLGNGTTDGVMESLREFCYFAPGYSVKVGSSSGDESELLLTTSCWSLGHGYDSGDTSQYVIITQNNTLTLETGSTVATRYIYRATRVNGIFNVENSTIIIGDSSSSSNKFLTIKSTADYSFQNVVIVNTNLLEIIVSPTVFDRVTLIDSKYGITAYGTVDVGVEELTVVEQYVVIISSYYVISSTSQMTSDDPLTLISAGDITIGTNGGYLLQRNSCNIHISSADGQGLNDAAISCTSAHLVLDDDGNVYRCIQDSTGNQPKNSPTYWELDSGYTAGGDYDASFAYKAADTIFSGELTASSGGVSGYMTEQIVPAKKWTDTAKFYEKYELTFTVTATGKEPIVLERITPKAALNWHFEMQLPGDFPDPGNVLEIDTTNGVAGTYVPDFADVANVHVTDTTDGVAGTLTFPPGSDVLTRYSSDYGLGGVSETPAATDYVMASLENTEVDLQ